MSQYIGVLKIKRTQMTFSQYMNEKDYYYLQFGLNNIEKKTQAKQINDNQISYSDVLIYYVKDLDDYLFYQLNEDFIDDKKIPIRDIIQKKQIDDQEFTFALKLYDDNDEIICELKLQLEYIDYKQQESEQHQQFLQLQQIINIDKLDANQSSKNLENRLQKLQSKMQNQMTFDKYLQVNKVEQCIQEGFQMMFLQKPSNSVKFLGEFLINYKKNEQERKEGRKEIQNLQEKQDEIKNKLDYIIEKTDTK